MWFDGEFYYLLPKDRYDKNKINDPNRIKVTFCVLAFAEPSEYGYRNGKISKVEIRFNGKVVLHFDRKYWDVKPDKTDKDYDAIMHVFKSLCQMYN